MKVWQGIIVTVVCVSGLATAGILRSLETERWACEIDVSVTNQRQLQRRVERCVVGGGEPERCVCANAAALADSEWAYRTARNAIAEVGK